MKKWILFLAFLSSVPALAVKSATVTYKVKQVIKSHKLVVVQTNATEEFPNGKIFLASFNDGTQCSLVLKNSGKQLLTLDSTPCDQLDRLSLKTKIEPALIPVDEQPPIETKQSKVGPEENTLNNFYDKTVVSRWGASVYYSSANHLKFDQGHMTSSGVNFKSDLEMENAIGVGVHYTLAKPNAWGYSFGGLYETKREFKKNTITISGSGPVTNELDGDRMKLALLIVEGNALYRWEKFYMPFGLNLTIPLLDYKSDIASAVASADFGLQLGLGYFINESLSAELYYRVIGIKIRETALSDGSTTDYGAGYMGGAALGLKYLF